MSESTDAPRIATPEEILALVDRVRLAKAAWDAATQTHRQVREEARVRLQERDAAGEAFTEVCAALDRAVVGDGYGDTNG